MTGSPFRTPRIPKLPGAVDAPASQDGQSGSLGNLFQPPENETPVLDTWIQPPVESFISDKPEYIPEQIQKPDEAPLDLVEQLVDEPVISEPIDDAPHEVPVRKIPVAAKRRWFRGRGTRQDGPVNDTKPVASLAIDQAFSSSEEPLIAENVEPGEGVLLASGIAKSFGKRQILKDIQLSVRKGEVVGLLGPNGAGKTTSFYIVCGLLRPDAGKISIDGRDITNLPVYRRARLGLGYLPQEASIFRGMNVEKNIMSILQTQYRSRRKRYQKLEELLNDFSIQHIRKSPALALSGGERRRVEIARALAANPKFILLDEPFAGVDPIAVGDIRNLVSQLKNRGIGVLITDHNVRDTLSVVDKAFIIFEGQVLKQGTPTEIVADDRVRRVYLGDNFSL